MSRSKLLVVDDSQSVRLAVSRILSKAGYDVIAANDGLQAIEMLDEDPSLIVLDIKMPGLDGYGVCEKIRAMGFTYSQMPVVFLTSVESCALELLGREFGAYLKKPVNETELLTVVQQQLALAAG